MPHTRWRLQCQKSGSATWSRAVSGGLVPLECTACPRLSEDCYKILVWREVPSRRRFSLAPMAWEQEGWAAGAAGHWVCSGTMQEQARQANRPQGRAPGCDHASEEYRGAGGVRYGRTCSTQKGTRNWQGAISYRARATLNFGRNCSRPCRTKTARFTGADRT